MKNQNLVELAEQMVAGGDLDTATEHLVAAIKGMPAGWSPVNENAKSVSIHFWDREEFFAYVNFHPNPSKPLAWVTGSYSKAFYMLGAIASKRNRLAQALEYIEQGLKLEGDHPELWCQRGVVLAKLKRHSEAVDAYTRATRVREWAPSDQIARALRGLGVQLIDLGRLDEAEQALDQSLELEPDSEVAKNELEYIAQQRSKHEAQPPVPWFVHAILHPPQDSVTLELMNEVRGLPSIPGPKTVGSESYGRISRAFQERGWVGFEGAFDEIVPRTRPDYRDVKRQLLCEPLFNPEAHRNMTRLLAAEAGVSGESTEVVLDEILGRDKEGES